MMVRDKEIASLEDFLPRKSIYENYSKNPIDESNYGKITVKGDDIPQRPDNIPPELWNELTNKEKIERTAGIEIKTPGFVDLHKIDFNLLVSGLEKQYMFSSNGDAYVINKLIKFYRENNK